MKMMDLEIIEKYVKKQNQLQEEIKVLLADKKILQDKIKVLSECLSLKKIKQKISDLENKQKILTSLESMLDNLKSDIKPLEYLKQLLHKELMVSTLSNNDFEIKKQNDFDVTLSTVNSECAIETLDSLNDASSESSDESIIILSEYDVLSDDECLNDNTEKPPPKKVMYNEALQMASSVHSLFSSTIESPIGSILPSPNISDQMKEINFSVESKETALMNTSSTSEQLLKMYDIVNEEDLHCNNEIKLKCQTRKIEPSTNKLCIINDTFKDSHIKSLDIKKCDNVSKLFNDSWVKVEPNELFKISFNSEQHEDIFQAITGLQEDIVMPKIKTEIEIFAQDDQIESKNCISLKNRSITNTDINTLVENDHSYEFHLKPKNINEIKSFEDVFNNVDNNNINEINNSISTNIFLNDQSNSLLLNTKGSNIFRECNEEKINNEVKAHVQKDQSYFNQSKSMVTSDSDITNPEKTLNNLDYNEINRNLVYQTNVPKDDVNSLLLNIKSYNIFKDYDDLSYNINTNIYFNDDHKKPLQLGSIHGFNTLGLNDELLNGIYQHGFQKLLAFQHKYISHCINKRDVIIHSYPCVGKSTMCFISVLQKIDTSINECQAIILVSTLELALLAQRMINSIGKFLNVSTCIGGTNVPRKVSPVPHIVISTLHGLCEMINCNSLCKDYINMLIIDDADEMIKYHVNFNNIRQVLLFLNNDRQIIILSISKFEEILDQFAYTMQDPEYIIVPEERPYLNDIIQYYVYVSNEWKFDAICDLYELLRLTHSLVYCNTLKKSLEVVDNMSLKTYSVSILHNEMKPSHRQLILQQFRSGISKVLVTTGLLRGENFSNVTWVINYDLPKSTKDYARRIVGYFDHTVKVINFITKKDKTTKKNIETELNINMLSLPLNVTDLTVPNFNSVDYPISS